MEYITMKNFSNEDKGSLLLTKEEVILSVNDQYLSNGFAGLNIFTWTNEQAKSFPNKRFQKVIGKSKDCIWKYSGNNEVFHLPILDIE